VFACFFLFFILFTEIIGQSLEGKDDHDFEEEKSTNGLNFPSPFKDSTTKIMGQFKAWTLDRKFLKSKGKKSEKSLIITESDQSLKENIKESQSLSTINGNEINKNDNVFEDNIFEDETTSVYPQQAINDFHKLFLETAEITSASDLNVKHQKPPCPRSVSSSNGFSFSQPDRVTLNEMLKAIPEEKDYQHEMIGVTLVKDEKGELGIYVTGKMDANQKMGYLIADFEPNGVAYRYTLLLFLSFFSNYISDNQD